MIDYIHTPWDTRAFGFKTAELQINSAINGKEFNTLYLDLEKQLKEDDIKFVYTRIDAQNFSLRKAIQEQGFYFAESSLAIVRNKVQKFEKEKFPSINYLAAMDSDVGIIKEIARSSFHYSRFHEDPQLKLERSRDRYFNWVDDLVKQNATIKVAKVGNNLVGFNIQKEDHSKQESSLILAGCADGKQLYTMSLWNEIIHDNKNMGMKKIKTLISSSNINMFNLYAHFDFKVSDTYFGFHKFL